MWDDVFLPRLQSCYELDTQTSSQTKKLQECKSSVNRLSCYTFRLRPMANALPRSKQSFGLRPTDAQPRSLDVNKSHSSGEGKHAAVPSAETRKSHLLFIPLQTSSSAPQVAGSQQHCETMALIF